MGRVIRPRAKPTSIVLDDDLVARLRQKGSKRGLGYQTMLKLIVRTSVDDIFDPWLLDEVRASWERTLGPFVRDLPAIDEVLVDTRSALERHLPRRLLES